VSERPLVHPLLAERRIHHGFGVRGARLPAGLLRPRQVHGARIVTDAECEATPPAAADGVVSSTPGRPIAVVTADCVPILMASACGSTVAAVHAGWRGLAAGVVEAGVAALRSSAPTGSPLLAVIGPYIGACCYEVDAPVVDALRQRYAERLDRCARATRPGHSLIDLGGLARAALQAAGLAKGSVAALPDACTRCDSERFHSFRRDGERAGRLVHFIIAGGGRA
jgi:YfiH family protein